MIEKTTTFDVVRDALTAYGEYSAWLVTASDDEKHAITIVEDLIGRSVLEQVAENVAAHIAEDEP
ncbi:MAG: hypothetical protein HEQ38_17265 [Gemmatimonas sp.]|nr:hypothetical protein [Gemmatimonas sp.]